MIGGHQFCAAEIEPLAAEFRDALGGLQQGLRGAAAKGADHFGFDGVNLAHQEWGAGGDFVFFGEAIFRGATFYYVGDVDVFALQAHGFDHVGEKFSGTADERFAAQIFVTARAFADEHQVGVGIASAEDDLGAAFVELTAGAVADVFADSRESVACDAFNGFEERWRGGWAVFIADEAGDFCDADNDALFAAAAGARPEAAAAIAETAAGISAEMVLEAAMLCASTDDAAEAASATACKGGRSR